jgi:hypothetical protein
MFAQMAMDWIAAERVADPKTWQERKPTDDELAIVCDRVYQVISGNVLWKECGPGDRAVWKARFRDIVRFERSVRDQAASKPLESPKPSFRERHEASGRRLAPGPRVPGYRERRWWNYYDTWENVGRDGDKWYSKQERRLFGNKNIGMPFLTNLQVPGQTGSDETFVVEILYVHVSSLAALHWAADRILATFVIGERPATPTLFVRDLFRGIILERPLIIPVRQNFSATIILKELPPDDLDPFDLSFHFEGLQSRDGV